MLVVGKLIRPQSVLLLLAAAFVAWVFVSNPRSASDHPTPAEGADLPNRAEAPAAHRGPEERPRALLPREPLAVAQQREGIYSGRCFLEADGRLEPVDFAMITVAAPHGPETVMVRSGEIWWSDPLDGALVVSAEDELGALAIDGQRRLTEGVQIVLRHPSEQRIELRDAVSRDRIPDFALSLDGVVRRSGGGGAVTIECERGWDRVQVSADGYKPSSVLLDRSRDDVVLWLSPSAELLVELTDECALAVARAGGNCVLEASSSAGERDFRVVSPREREYRFSLSAGSDWKVRVVQATGQMQTVIASRDLGVLSAGETSVELGAHSESVGGFLDVEILRPRGVDKDALSVKIVSIDSGGAESLVSTRPVQLFEETEAGTWMTRVRDVPSGALLVRELTTGVTASATVVGGGSALALLDLGPVVRSEIDLGTPCLEQAGVVVWSYEEGEHLFENRIRLEPDLRRVALLTLPRDLRYRLARGSCRAEGDLPCSRGPQHATALLTRAPVVADRVLELRAAEGALPVSERVWYGLQIIDVHGDVVDLPRTYGGWGASRPTTGEERARDGARCVVSLPEGHYDLRRRGSGERVAEIRVVGAEEFVPVFVSEPALLAGL